MTLGANGNAGSRVRIREAMAANLVRRGEKRQGQMRWWPTSTDFFCTGPSRL
jgi:hypothetical protein